MRLIKYALASVALATLVACGGGGGGSSGTTVAGVDTVVGITAANGVQMVRALEALALTYTNGVADFGTVAPTTVIISDTATGSPTFRIESGGLVAPGTLSFGSCIFTIGAGSTFPAGHPLGAGKQITVTPCELRADTDGQTANNLPIESDVQLVLGGSLPEPRKLPITITPTGAVQIVTTSGTVIPLGTISVVAVTGGS